MLFTFGPQAGQLLLFKSGPPATCSSETKSGTTRNSDQCIISERTDHNAPSPYRVLQFASHRTFMKLNQNNSYENVLRCSGEYRKQLKIAINQLIEEVNGEEGGGSSLFNPLETHLNRCFTQHSHDNERSDLEMMDWLCSYLQQTEIVWHLCELLHLELPSKPIAADVVIWLRKLEDFVRLVDDMPGYLLDEEDELNQFLQERGNGNKDRFFIPLLPDSV